MAGFLSDTSDIQFAKSFRKQFKKLDRKIQDQFWHRYELWIENPDHPHLHDYALIGNYSGYRSINITGDVRALYRKRGDTIVIFALIGTHGQLYGK